MRQGGPHGDSREAVTCAMGFEKADEGEWKKLEAPGGSSKSEGEYSRLIGSLDRSFKNRRLSVRSISLVMFSSRSEAIRAHSSSGDLLVAGFGSGAIQEICSIMTPSGVGCVNVTLLWGFSLPWIDVIRKEIAQNGL